MLRKFLGGKARPAASAPEGRTIYAVGDLHGRADLLARLQDKIREDAAASGVGERVVIYLGDYIDRGPASCEVIDRLLDDPLEGFESVHLLGNHEDALLTFLHDPAVALGWFNFGGLATLQSYGLRPKPSDTDNHERLKALQEELSETLPQAHLDFLRGLSLYHREGDYLFVHAGLRPGRPLEQQDSRDLITIRDEFLESRADHGCVVVHGHSISQEPQVAKNRIGIDTGAYATGRLTCLRLEADKRDFLHT